MTGPTGIEARLIEHILGLRRKVCGRVAINRDTDKIEGATHGCNFIVLDLIKMDVMTLELAAPAHFGP